MPEEEIKIQKALGTYLSMKWKECQKLLKEGRKLYEEGLKLWGGYNPHTEGYKLYEEGNKLRNKGYRLYKDAVKEVYGDKEVLINWTTGEVKLRD